MPIAAAISIVGLLVVAIVTLSLINGQLPFSPGGGGNGPAGVGDGPAPDRHAVERGRSSPRRAAGLRSRARIVYAKAGNVWVQTGDRPPS